MSILEAGVKLIVSEITWLTSERPPAIQIHWEGVYPEIDVASAKVELLERHGYSPQAFLERHNFDAQAKVIVAAEEREIALSERNGGLLQLRRLRGEEVRVMSPCQEGSDCVPARCHHFAPTGSRARLAGARLKTALGAMRKRSVRAADRDARRAASSVPLRERS